ncbi:MAG: N-acetylmuramoyl-L-alanine amidase [Thermoanaerobaculia bacterium]
MTGEERRIKRRLLREVVAENVELKAGLPPRPRTRRRARGGLLLKVAGLLVAPAAVFASSLVLSGGVGFGGGPLAEPAGLLEPAASRGVEGSAAGSRGAPPEGARSRQSPEGGGAGPAGSAAISPDPTLVSRSLDGDIFPLAVRRIALDPGHGGTNIGTRTPGGLEEKFLTLDIARRVQETLEEYSFEVLMTREEDVGLTLQERAALANRQRADIFVSIHVNWFEGSRESGIETYYLGPTDDPFLSRLAASENVDSGHTLAEMRELLDRIYAGVRQDKSESLARRIHGALYRSLHRVNPKLRNRGVKTAPFLVLVDTEMPAVLAEVAALSSEAEAAMLEKPLYREYIADSLAAGIVAYAESMGSRDPMQKGS